MLPTKSVFEVERYGKREEYDFSAYSSRLPGRLIISFVCIHSMLSIVMKTYIVCLSSKQI